MAWSSKLQSAARGTTASSSQRQVEESIRESLRQAGLSGLAPDVIRAVEMSPRLPFPFPGPPGRQRESEPVTPPPAPSQVELALATIPRAIDGDVITAEHHNALREAVRVIAAFLGGESLARIVTVSLAPALVAQGSARQWKLESGRAVQPAKGVTKGWMPAALPDGSGVERVDAFGVRAKTAGSFFVELARREIRGAAGEAPEALCRVDLHEVGESGTSPRPVSASAEVGDGVSASAVESLRTVDNSRYTYLLSAELNASTASKAELHAIEVVCSKW
jgi:hypothetical protein